MIADPIVSPEALSRYAVDCQKHAATMSASTRGIAPGAPQRRSWQAQDAAIYEEARYAADLARAAAGAAPP